MEPLARIVVPVDLDQHTQKIVDFAIYMANRLDSEIFFFHSVEPIESVAMGEMAMVHFSYEDFNSAHAEQAEKSLAEIINKATDKCKKCHSKIVIGDAVDSILQYAENQKADMIIMGTHGKRGVEKILIGSVAERVLKRAHCPVLTMNPYR
jgi:nucleotide-binding universal stress UspA family protein